MLSGIGLAFLAGRLTSADDANGFFGMVHLPGRVPEKEKRDFIPLNARDGAEVSRRRPPVSQERDGKKKRRPAPFGPARASGMHNAQMTGGAGKLKRESIR